MDLLTISRIKAARSCLRYHKYRFLDGVKPVKEDEARAFGSLSHVGLEAWWKAWSDVLTYGPRLDNALDAMREMPGTDPFELAKAEVLLIGYDTVWGEEPYEVLGVEVEFHGDLVNPVTGASSKTWQQRGKIDVVVRDQRDGRTLVVEHKTSAEDIRQGSEYWRRLRMDGQISTYFDGARFLGYDPAGCLYDVIKKPGLRPSQVPLLDDQGVKIVKDASGARVRTKDGKKWRETADTAQGYVLQTRPETVQEYRNRVSEAVLKDPTEYFQRAEVARLEADLDEHRTDTWQFAQALRSMIVAGRAPRNPDACVRWSRTCEYFPACSGETSIDDPLRFKRAETAFPELTQLGTPERRERPEEPKEQIA